MLYHSSLCMPWVTTLLREYVFRSMYISVGQMLVPTESNVTHIHSYDIFLPCSFMNTEKLDQIWI